ncbi:MAG: aminoacyl-tRNA hydrolase [Candidatus Nealsonbacteria bacterium]|nr:aminoacyl-tRNA hydrolase [Candidatus Nealsonbacteria bacterium]
MLLIVGLGNPSKKYEKTRHNIGSRVIGELETLNLRNVILAKPTIFMNESGKAVKILNIKYKIKNINLWVIHDDIDIPLGEFKIQKGRGAAGHKGVESIIKELKTKNFNRIRIGICPERGKPKQVDRFVLQSFAKAEEKTLKEVIKQIITEIEKLSQ